MVHPQFLNLHFSLFMVSSKKYFKIAIFLFCLKYVQFVNMICFKLGGGGTGKSYLIQTTSQWVDKILREANDNPLKPKILLLAYTENAASLIGGTTFHSGLAFKFGSGLLPLTNEKKAKYTSYLEDVEVVVVDEMSMASSDIL